MEPRNYESGASESAPLAPETPSVGYPTAGNPGTGTPATKPGPFWFYKIGESLRRIIVEAGLTPNDGDLGQLKTALVSPQVDVNAGVDDNRFVTPKKLRLGFSFQSGMNGYLILPTWMMNIIFQWGMVDSIGLEQISTPFNTPFLSGAYIPLVVANDSGARFCTSQRDSNTSFYVNKWNRDGNRAGGSFFWFAVGR